MGELYSICHGLDDDCNSISERGGIDHRCTNAATCGQAGDQQAVGPDAGQVVVQLSSEEGAGSAFDENLFISPRLKIFNDLDSGGAFQERVRLTSLDGKCVRGGPVGGICDARKDNWNRILASRPQDDPGRCQCSPSAGTTPTGILLKLLQDRLICAQIICLKVDQQQSWVRSENDAAAVTSSRHDLAVEITQSRARHMRPQRLKPILILRSQNSLNSRPDS
jgi:hypothetical protein